MMRLVTDDFETGPDTASLAAIGPGAPGPGSSAAAPSDWPPEVDLILSAMDAAMRPVDNRRAADRRPYRARADLRLYAHDPAEPSAELFTRDVSATGLGFITRHRLPLGYNGLVQIYLDDGEMVTASCSVYRCRQAIDGWYEGALHFAARQATFG